MIKKILPSILGLGLILLGNKANAQLNYTVSYPTVNYSAITGGTNPPITLCDVISDGAPTSDEGAANGISLPFSFKFNNLDYTKINLCTNGFITLGTATNNPKIDSFSANYFNSLAFGPIKLDGTLPTNRPIIAPLWDDLDLQATTNLTYKTTGTTPNRIFTVQWSNAKWSWTATAASINFQLKLYETTNVIDFAYKTAAGALSTGAGASIGLADTSIGTGSFLSLSGVTNTATNSFKTETTTIATKPANNFCIRFTPIIAPAVDAAVYDMTAPANFVSCFNSNKNVSVTIANKGTTNIAIGASSAVLSVIGANAQSITKTNTTLLTPGATEIITYSLNLNNPTTVSDSLAVVISTASDGRSNNDTTFRYSSTAGAYTGVFPINDGGNLSAMRWLKSLNGTSNRWYLRTSGYFNTALGDSVKANSGNDFYMFFPLNSSSKGSRAYIYSDCISLPNTGNPNDYTLSFNMTHDTSRPDIYIDESGVGIHDSLYIAVSNDNGQSWTRIGGWDRVGADVPTYQNDSVSLAAYAGQTIQIGLEGVAYYGNAFGVDDITLGTSALPVKLNSFSGVREGNKNILNWQTANEVNNKGFELERSIDGREFTKIAVINSKATNGTSNGANDYSYTDEKYFGATNYYRLRQLDKDGKATLSNVVVLKSAQITKAQISRIFPNPVQEKLNVVLNTPTSERVTITISDLVGKTITQKFVETVQGDNNIQFNTVQLAKGTYLIKVYSNTNTEIATQKFVK